MDADGLEIVECNGVRIVIDPAIMSEFVQIDVRRGRLSVPEADRIGGLIEPGERFVEFGGGIGYTSAIVARQNRAASITTFEADPQLIPAMHRTHALNGVEATVVNAVVLARKEADTVPFYVHRHFCGSSLIEPSRGVQSVVEVPVMSFADVMETYRPTMFMIDIEGAEADLLQDADLSGVRKLYVELHKDLIGERGIKRVFDALSAQGFYYDPAPSVASVVLFRRIAAQ